MELIKENCFEHETFRNKSFLKGNLSAKDFYSCKFINSDFTECDFSRSNFYDCTFINTNLSLVKVHNVQFHSAVFDACKIFGVDFSKINQFLLEMRFENCAVYSANFSGLKFTELSFNECKITDSDFSDSKMRHSVFKWCDLKGTLFRNSDLFAANFTDSVNYSIDPLINNIKKAKFSLPEAMTLLKAFEIEIE